MSNQLAQLLCGHHGFELALQRGELKSDHGIDARKSVNERK